MDGHFLVLENESEEFDIRFQVHSVMTDPIPKEQKELYVEAESACNIIKSLVNTDKEIKKKYFKKLLSLCQVGLSAQPAQTDTAKLALIKLKEEVVLVEGKRIKNYYMKILGLDAIIIGLLASIVLGICFYFSKWTWCPSTLCIIWGSLAGTWVSFGARKFEIQFEDLAALEKDKMSPFIRLIYIAVAALIFALLMNVGLVDIKIGNVDTSMAFTDVKPALVIGILCGLVESKIGIQVYNKAIFLLMQNGSE